MFVSTPLHRDDISNTISKATLTMLRYYKLDNGMLVNPYCCSGPWLPL